ncbi:hypothetical protein FALBO_3554 [Fusarium albosuccineum]|uniref:Uncharacterized protein n=1 Tax=Fusarium albosuccineum TaxID=1237068 RepID=A0A8H4LLB0_9HYPO|nr:hypothetical protein FALBO_3554 [Fusarium albosuccineum]
MTGRGKAGNPAPPVLPSRDPTLETRPVPRERHFQARSFGPGAASDIRSTVRPVKELEAMVNSDAHDDKYGDVVSLLRTIQGYDKLSLHQDGSGLNDPTWGFFIFVTSYSTAAMENLDPAVLKVVEVVRRTLEDIGHPLFAAEAHKRLKLDVLQDKEALEDASDDRIREEFNSFIRGLGFWPDDDDDTCGPLSLGRYVVGLVFDEAKILELAGLSLPESPEDDYKALENVSIKVIDCPWQRPANGRGHYQGVDNCPITALPNLFDETSAGDSGAMMDMYPLQRKFY